MSTRSTPRAGSSQLPRTLSFSSEVSFDPSSSRRHTRTDSLRMPTLPESVVSSGLSSPDTRRRRYLSRKKSDSKGSVAGMREEVDWAGVEPDEVFRRLPISEIKRVEQKMRTDALNKQSELRSMVGTRYRDLLTSATQITTLRSSSLRLSESLKSISQACSNPADVTLVREDGSELADTADVMAVLPVAAHVKLLLDAPEALYSFLSRHSFLDAAYLWLIARVTKEGLTNMPYETSGAYLEITEKQWETLLPLRSQIVNRAAASLRSRVKTDAKTLSETILALILLDNLTISDALSLFLTQRSKAVRDILHYGNDSVASPTVKTRRRSSTASRDKSQISKVLTEAVNCLIETATLSTSVFDKRRKLDNDSVLEEMIKLVQKAETVPQASQPMAARHTSHERRASRLASISSPLPNLGFTNTGSPVTAQKVLQAMPSAQILLRHLPSTITAFTPFITPSPLPNVAARLNDWRTTSTSALAEAVPSWLAALQSIQDVWSIRSTLITQLGQGDHQDQIRAALEHEWADRVKAIWSAKLDSIVDVAEEQLQQGVTQLGHSPGPTESDAGSFAFSELNYPSVPATALASGSTQSISLGPFMASLKQRSSGRTPLLNDTLTALEDAASTLRIDVADLSSNLAKEYQTSVGSSLDRLVEVLETSLAKNADAVEASLHVGRVALFIAHSSSVLPSLVEDGDKSDSMKSTLTAIHAQSTSAWQTRTIRSALQKLAPLLSSTTPRDIVRSTWQSPFPTQPSTEITLALHELVIATRQLGIPRGVDTGVTKTLVETMVTQAKGLDGWNSKKGEAGVQAAVDLGFLTLLKGGDVGQDEMVKSCLSTLPADLPTDFADRLPTILADHLRRSQLLLHPLLEHLPPTILPPAQHTASAPSARNTANFLRFSAPTPGEFINPVAVAKPGKRFGLLSIAV